MLPAFVLLFHPEPAVATFVERETIGNAVAAGSGCLRREIATER